MKNTKIYTSMLVLILVMILAQGVLAAYPENPITYIVPWSVGGASDSVSRVLTEIMEEELGQPVQVINKPGAGSMVGLGQLAASRPDGYTIGLATSSLMINQHIGTGSTTYKDLKPVGLILSTPGAVGVRSDSEWDNMEDLVKYAKENPGKVRVGNTGRAAAWHLLGVQLEGLAGVEFSFVPYEGGAPMTAALLGGHIDVGTQSVPGFASHVKAGDLKFLGVAGDVRHDAFPDAPTLKEQGIDLSFNLMTGIFAPKGTPDEYIEVISDALEKAMQAPKFKEFCENNAQMARYLGPKDFLEYLKAYDKSVEESAIKAGLKSK